MFQIGGSRPAARRGGGLWPLNPIGALAGMVAVAMMAALTLLGLGLAFAFLRGKRGGAVRRGTFPGGGWVSFGNAGDGRAAPGAARGPEAAGTGANANAAAGPGRVADGGSPPVPPATRERSYAEVVEAWPILLLGGLLLGAGVAPAQAKMLVPMDETQSDHLKAYGLAYHALQHGQKSEWLLNYRGGSFLLPDDAALEREANLRGVRFETMGGAAEAQMRAEIADNNMESVMLEKVPKIAVYIPPNTPPWDDAVTLALEYADIPYVKLWDEEVVRGDLKKYDWLHLHHEDFTGQHGKFYSAYHTFPWYQEEERVQKAMAERLGYAKITQLKAAVALAIRDYIAGGGFMFGMCSATDTYDIALSALGVDIADVVYDGDPPDPGAEDRLDFGRTLAFKDFRIDTDPYLYRFSDIDVTQEAAQRGPNAVFTLFDFSAKNDPVPTMLIQDHVNAVPEFLGQNTGFRRSKMKSGVLALAEVEGTDEVKYLHGQFGRGTFTFLGGHDPEDYQHMVGDPPTDLAKFRNSPGYRLILNNVLFPAAEKKKQRT